MTPEAFNRVLNDRIEKMQDTLSSKAKEYARTDRLHNFKRAAAALQCSPEQSCVGFWMKHIVSLLDMVNDIDRTKGVVIWNRTLWDEKIGDAINYLVLLEALVSERLGK